jgi:hypothetical protein
MDDLGEPVSHLGLADGVPVYDRDGERVGVVDRVIADERADIFEGLVVHTRPVVPGRHFFASYEQIAEMRERGVRLAVGRDELYPLDEHSGRRRSDDGSPESRVEAALRKAWDWVSGAR